MKDVDFLRSMVQEAWDLFTWPGKILIFPWLLIGMTILVSILFACSSFINFLKWLFIAKNYR